MHGRVVRGEPVSPRIDGDVRDPEGSVLLDDQTKESVAARERADRGPGLAADPRGDEGLDLAMPMDGPEGRVVRPHEQPDLVHDHLEDIVDGQQAGDGPGRGIEGVDDIDRCLCVLAALHVRHGSSAWSRSQPSSCRLARPMRAGWPVAWAMVSDTLLT